MLNNPDDPIQMSMWYSVVLVPNGAGIWDDFPVITGVNNSGNNKCLGIWGSGKLWNGQNILAGFMQVFKDLSGSMGSIHHLSTSVSMTSGFR